MRGEKLDLTDAELGKMLQPVQVMHPVLVIDRHQPLEHFQTGRAGWFVRHLVVMEIGVAAVQEPAVAGIDRHAAVPARMAGQRHQQDFILQARNGANRFKTLPFFPFLTIRHPVRLMRLVMRLVALLFAESGMHRGLVFRLVNMHFCFGEIT